MKLSIIVAIYNSHEALRRQILYFDRMNLPNDIEFIIVDDGSNPQFDSDDYDLNNLTIYFTYDKRPWTQGLARNFGAKKANGEYLFFTDIDHILSYEAIMEGLNFEGEKMIFPRFIAVLDEEGKLTQDIEVLEKYGFDTKRLNTSRKLYASYHGNTYVIKKSTFNLL